MSDKKQQILDLVKEYILEKRQSESWTPGEDWVSYSGPIFDENEYVAAFESLLTEWLIFGKKGREFELEFAQHLGKDAGILTNSGSSANLLAVSALKSRKWFNLKPGAKFITPVVCFPTTINPLIQNGFEPVFVDVTIPDLNLDLDQVERVLEEDPEIKGIMFAHVLGNPPDMDRLMFLVKKYDLIFVEDACDALGSYYDGKKLGSFGTISTCSFFPAHHMTMGEGGFVATDSSVKRMVLASYRDWGRACYCNTAKPGSVTSGTACGDRFKNWLPGMPTTTFDHRYVFDEIGYNLKPLDLAAAMGLEQIKKLPMLDASRRKNFDRLKEIFAPYEEYFHLPEATEKADPCWFGFLLTIRDGANFGRHDLVNFLESKKIQTRSYFSGLVLAHPGYIHLAGPYGNLEETFPVAAKVTHDSFFLGTFHGLTTEKLDYIEASVKEFFDRPAGLTILEN
jgi:CDP-6-deoxy-D-xylo-4-hexulose-3-dehydrase